MRRAGLEAPGISVDLQPARGRCATRYATLARGKERVRQISPGLGEGAVGAQVCGTGRIGPRDGLEASRQEVAEDGE